MTQPIRVLALCGSLRQKSFNKMALAVAKSVAPAGMTIDVAEIGDLPLYNDDVYTAGCPAPAQRLRDQCAAADAFLFVTPEYNFSIPGVLKNAIDWASRPPNVPMFGKPCAIMGASMGPLGTGRAQYHLRQICVFLDLKPVNKPEVFIAAAHTKFDEQGNFKDEVGKGLIKDLMANLHAWTVKLKG
ncbi:MAG: NAD(P)H-dependent oxidoreductase [Alphaproteobacteria bacterium]|nr:NAD(P)H-dependent oxidoreductase [Alphaproteobacteria bacterium]